MPRVSPCRLLAGSLRPVAVGAPPLSLRRFTSRVAAGFPSPADDHLESPLDLNAHLVAHPAATFVVRVQGDSMSGAGIRDGDLLGVDRAREAQSGAIVVAVVDGELTVKRLRRQDGRISLVPENPDYAAVEVSPEASFEVWGVVTSSIHKA